MVRPTTLSLYVAGLLMLPANASGAEALHTNSSAARPLIKIAAQMQISAPETVDPGQLVHITTSDSKSDGQLELWGPVTQESKGERLTRVLARGTESTLDAPIESGSYQLRYVSPKGITYASKPLEVAAAPVTLCLAEQMNAGLESAVRWRGPARPGDMLQIIDPSTGAVLSEAAAAGQPGRENFTPLRAPEKIGSYDLRYWSGSRQTTVRSLSFNVVSGAAWLRSPVEVPAGKTFTAEWKGPVARDHAFQIFNPQTNTVVSSQVGAEGATFTAPQRQGSYRIRYVDTATGFVHSELPLLIAPG